MAELTNGGAIKSGLVRPIHWIIRYLTPLLLLLIFLNSVGIMKF
ncbi:hypothetical protein [Hydrogenispora ethanolica]|nr:hypothetical protein [Hydrogenispora ethanolica]